MDIQVVTEQKTRFENQTQADQLRAGSDIKQNAAESCQAGIEVTPEMAKAGSAAFHYYDSIFSGEDEIFAGVYRAMTARHFTEPLDD